MTALGFNSDLSPGAKVTMGVSGGTTKVCSPSYRHGALRQHASQRLSAWPSPALH
ncbi:MAG: hypothetical protein ACKVP3_21130 [Hyphomicrobiaceae bacterium]